MDQTSKRVTDFAGKNILVTGKPNSGKTTEAFFIASEILLAKPDTYCLVFCNKAKIVRKRPFVLMEESLSNRFLLKFITTKQTLFKYICELHFFHDKAISCIIIEDLHVIMPRNNERLYVNLCSLSSVFPNLSLIVTKILGQNERVEVYRHIFDLYEFMQNGKAEQHIAHLSMKKTSKFI